MWHRQVAFGGCFLGSGKGAETLQGEYHADVPLVPGSRSPSERQPPCGVSFDHGHTGRPPDPELCLACRPCTQNV